MTKSVIGLGLGGLSAFGVGAFFLGVGTGTHSMPSPWLLGLVLVVVAPVLGAISFVVWRIGRARDEIILSIEAAQDFQINGQGDLMTTLKEIQALYIGKL